MYHQPVMPVESIKYLDVKPDGIYVDATFGGGGHSKLILNKLQNGRLIAFDQDADTKQNSINDSRFTLINTNFIYIQNYLEYLEIPAVDGIIADLGVSSFQLDEPSKGFSYLHEDAKLDMRMNPNNSKSAVDVLNLYSEEMLVKIFFEYAEINFAKKLARKIVSRRKDKKIETVRDFTTIIDEFIPAHKKFSFYSKIFQAIRIEVNDEINNLKTFLTQCLSILKKEGRMVVISYHSLEDRIVKNFFKTGNVEGILEKDFYGKTIKKFEVLTKKPITPTEEEIANNKRARSAKLRAAYKI